jgi:hypothetical protein
MRWLFNTNAASIPSMLYGPGCLLHLPARPLINGWGLNFYPIFYVGVWLFWPAVLHSHIIAFV